MEVIMNASLQRSQTACHDGNNIREGRGQPVANSARYAAEARYQVRCRGEGALREGKAPFVVLPFHVIISGFYHIIHVVRCN